MSDAQRFWVRPLQLRVHQITKGHRAVVFAEDHDALAARLAELEAERDNLKTLVIRLSYQLPRDNAVRVAAAEYIRSRNLANPLRATDSADAAHDCRNDDFNDNGVCRVCGAALGGGRTLTVNAVEGK